MQKMFGVLARGGAAAALGVSLALAAPGSAIAAVPDPIGDDGSYRLSHDVVTLAGPSTWANVWAVPTDVAVVGNEAFALSSPAHPPLPEVRGYDLATGQLTHSFEATYIDTGGTSRKIPLSGLWAAADGTLWVVGTKNDGTVTLRNYTPEGVLLSDDDLPGTPFDITNSESTWGLVGDGAGNFYSINETGDVAQIVKFTPATGALSRTDLPAGLALDTPIFTLEMTDAGDLLFVTDDSPAIMPWWWASMASSSTPCRSGPAAGATPSTRPTSGPMGSCTSRARTEPSFE